MRRMLMVLVMAALGTACAQADPDQYVATGNAPVYGESNGVFYDKTNDRLALFVNDVEVGYIDSSGNLTMDGTTTVGAYALADNTSTTYGTGSDSIIQYAATGSDPDSLFIGVGTDSRQLVIAETGDVATDMAIAQQTNPTVMIHSADATDAADYIMFAHNQTNGVIDVGQGYISLADSTWLTDDLMLAMGASDDGVLGFSVTTQAPDSVILGVGQESRQFVIAETADLYGAGATDLTIAQQTNPTLVIHSADATSATQYVAIAHDQTDAVITAGAGQIALASNPWCTDDIELDFGASDDAFISYDHTVQDPDSLVIGVSTDSRQLVIFEDADAATDLTLAQQTNPTLVIHSADATDANDYITLAHDQTNGVIAVGQGQVSIPAGITSSKTGGDVLTCTGAAPTITLKDNEAAALNINSSGTANFLLFDTTTNAEELNINGTTAVSAFRVDTGIATFDEQVTMTAGFTSAVTAADAITLTGSAPTMTLKDNEAAAFNINSSGTANFLVFDTTTNAEEININGNVGVSAFRVDTGIATFDEQMVCSAGVDMNGDILAGGGAGALTFDAASSSIVCTDDSTTGLIMGASGATTMMTLDTSNNAENVAFGNGIIVDTTTQTAAVSLDKSDCGTWQFLGDNMDADTIDLPSTVAGCVLNFMFKGTDGGALVDISPAAADAIHGSCYEETGDSLVQFSGADNADIGLTKVTANTGDYITLVGDGVDGWYVAGCAGIWANN